MSLCSYFSIVTKVATPFSESVAMLLSHSLHYITYSFLPNLLQDYITYVITNVTYNSEYWVAVEVPDYYITERVTFRTPPCVTPDETFTLCQQDKLGRSIIILSWHCLLPTILVCHDMDMSNRYGQLCPSLYEYHCLCKLVTFR